MSKQFRTCSLDQPLLLSPSLQDWLPEKHLARFIADVTEQLDLSEILVDYARRDGRGMAAYHPVMMVRVLLYGYCMGVVSSRKLEKATYEDVAFRYLAADQHPDHDSFASFRQTHLQALAGLFMQALQLCEKAGLVKRRRDGRVHSMRLEAKPMKEAQAWIDRYREFWEGNLDRFEDYLNKLQKQENKHDNDK